MTREVLDPDGIWIWFGFWYLTRVDNDLLFLLCEVTLWVPPAFGTSRRLRHEEKGDKADRDYANVSK